MGWFTAGLRDFSLLWYTQTGSRAYIAYLMFNRDFFFDLKEVKVCSQPLSPGTEVASAWSYAIFASWHAQEQLYLSNTVIPDLHHPNLCSTLMCLSQDPIYSVKPSAHIWTHNAEIFFELLKTMIRISHSNILLKFRSKALMKKLWNLSLSLRQERTVALLNVTEVPGLKVGIKVSEYSDSHKQRAATNRQGWMSMLACYDEILKEKKRFLSRHRTMLGFLKSSSGTLASPAVLLNIGGDDTDDPSAVQEEVSLS